MSPRFGNRYRLVTLFGALLVLSACSSGGGSRPADRAERADRPEVVAAESGAGAFEPATAGRSVTDPEAVALPPVEVPERAALSYERALEAMRDANWVEAELELEQLILEFRSFPGPYVNLAIIYRRDGRDDEAERALSEALAIAPNHPAANNELGVILRERGEFEQAEAAYRRALEGDASYALAHYNLGVLLDVYLRREGEALQHYEAYQAAVPVPDETVGRWIVDLRRRLGLPDDAMQIAQEDGR
ncbi:MAG: tetratricopeptide repeat protein [Gammaproteobacteria bacterium]|nr:tetratricopeptide repeat protein [Gammaproteobacteria bacterium]